MDHNRQPRNFRKLEPSSHHADGFNPFCGDTVTIFLDVKNNIIDDIGFQGHGCAISKASASMLTESIKGKSTSEADNTFAAFRDMLTDNTGDINTDALGDLELLRGVSAFPTRIKCATLAWHTLRSALEGDAETVRTE